MIYIAPISEIESEALSKQLTSVCTVHCWESDHLSFPPPPAVIVGQLLLLLLLLYMQRLK